MDIGQCSSPYICVIIVGMLWNMEYKSFGVHERRTYHVKGNKMTYEEFYKINMRKAPNFTEYICVELLKLSDIKDNKTFSSLSFTCGTAVRQY